MREKNSRANLLEDIATRVAQGKLPSNVPEYRPDWLADSLRKSADRIRRMHAEKVKL